MGGEVAHSRGKAEPMALSSLLGGQAARIAVVFADADTRETVSVQLPDGKDEEQFLFGAADNITGTVRSRVC